jgi:hypothetical protein
MRLLSVMPAVGGMVLLSASAWAQGLDGERFAPAAGAAGGLQLERPVVPAHLGYGLGLFLNLADDPVVARIKPPATWWGTPLDHGLSADLLASLGLFDHLRAGAAPAGAADLDGDAATVGGSALEAEPGLGDVRLVPKVSFGWMGDTQGGFAFGAAVPVSLPTGRASALRGAGGVTVEPRLLALVYGARWFLNGSLGFRVREAEGPGGAGNELTFGLGGTYSLPVEDDALEVQLEAWAAGCPTRTDGPCPICRWSCWGPWSTDRRPAGRCTPAGGWA